MGTVGRGDCRNYYKGHMDKIHGEGGDGGQRWIFWGWVEGWGEKAYNCNCITIKIKKNKIKCKIKIFPNKIKLKEFIITKLALQEMLKGLL